MFSTVIMMLIQQPVLLSVRFDNISTGHWIHVFNCNNGVNIKPVLLPVRFDSISIGHWFIIFVFLLN